MHTLANEHFCAHPALVSLPVGLVWLHVLGQAVHTGILFRAHHATVLPTHLLLWWWFCFLWFKCVKIPVCDALCFGYNKQSRSYLELTLDTSHYDVIRQPAGQITKKFFRQKKKYLVVKVDLSWGYRLKSRYVMKQT